MRKIVLASQSPRRRELLSSIQMNFMTKTVPMEEHLDESLPICKAVEKLAYEKAKAVQDLMNDEIIVGADTIVYYENEVLGKPKTMEESYTMIKKLSGHTHQVITGVCILYKSKVITFHEISDVTFFDLSEQQIQAYVNTKEGMDKAGAYGIQGLGKVLVEKIHGDYFNIVGLPVAKLNRILQSMDTKD